jgi:putative transposase
MLVFEYKLKGTDGQYRILDEVLRTARFVRNTCLRYWMDNPGKNKYDLNNYCTVLAKEYSWAKKLNSMARQASAERAWSAISRFYENCKAKKPGKKGFPRFRKEQTHASVEYKTCGWKLSEDRREITFTDGFKAGTFRMWGTRDLHYYQLDQIKRVRIVRRADGYYIQVCLDVERVEAHEFQNTMVGIDVGLNHFYTDSDGNQIENPRFLRKSEKALKRLNRRLHRQKKASKNRAKERKLRKHSVLVLINATDAVLF